jgi:DNA-binding XRE family transcriptional regulator
MENQLAKLRKQKNLTQEELASAVGVSRVHITKIENGSVCSIRVLSAIAKKLDVKIDDIFLT